MRHKIERFGYIGYKEFSHMKRFGILALALTFLTGAAVTSFAQATTTDSTTTTKKKKKTKKKADGSSTTDSTTKK
jgi:ABC-type phosphate transport system substrate-binding protein